MMTEDNAGRVAREKIIEDAMNDLVMDCPHCQKRILVACVNPYDMKKALLAAEKRVAGECAGIADNIQGLPNWDEDDIRAKSAALIATAIREKYGLEEGE